MTSYDPAAFQLVAAVQERHFWFRGRNRLLCWALGRYFPQARSMLEVGCGSGFVLQGLEACRPGLSLTGGDLHPEGLEIARRRSAARLEVMDAREIPYEGEFDVVGAFDVIEHIAEDDVALRAMHRALRPGGGLLLTVPQHPWLWSDFDELSHHQRRYTRAELLGKVRAAGFAVGRVTSFVTFVLPAFALARLRPRRGGEQGLEEQLSVPRFNGAFERLLSAELALIRRGVSLPVGSSLFLEAVRD